MCTVGLQQCFPIAYVEAMKAHAIEQGSIVHDVASYLSCCTFARSIAALATYILYDDELRLNTL